MEALKGLSTNIEAAQRRVKNNLVTEYDMLDILSETENLSVEEKERMKNIAKELDGIWKNEEIKACRRG